MDSKLLVEYRKKDNTLYIEFKGSPDVSPDELNTLVAVELERAQDGFSVLADYRQTNEWRLREISSVIMDVMRLISHRQPNKVARLVNEMVYGVQLGQMSSAAGLEGMNFIDPGQASAYLNSDASPE